MRVIAGSARRLLLKALDELDTRPTIDKIRETLFNVLQPESANYVLLDLLFGSGAIRIKALNREAGLAVIAESSPEALECTRGNLSRTKLERRIMVMGCDVITGLKRLEGKNYKFDIVFMDPPYNYEHKRLVLDYLNHSPMVTEETLIVIKASREIEFGWLEESGWYMIKDKEYKTNKYVFIGREEQMGTIVYPGSFDPAALGHYDIMEHTVKVVDKLIIGVLNDKAECPLFSTQERANMLKGVTSSLPNAETQLFEGPLIGSVRRSHADVVVRGLRAITDSEYELQMAQINRIVAPEIDTISLTTNLKYSYLNPGIVKEIAGCEGNTGEFLRPVTAARVGKKLEERRRLT